VKLETEQINLQTHTTASGADYYKINPKGNVPAIVLDDGTLLNENIATLLYIAAQNPGSVAPQPGTSDFYLLLSALGYITSEVHPAVGIFFSPNPPADVKALREETVAKKLSFLEKTLLAGKPFIVGNKLSIADLYLYIVLSWTAYVHIDLSPYPHVKKFYEGIAALDNVKAAQARIATSPSTTI